MKYKKLSVDLKTPLKKQLADLGVKSYINLDKIKNLHEPQEEIFDVEDGTEMLGKSPLECEKIFKKKGRRALTLIEALAIIRENPELLDEHSIDCADSRYENGNVPYLHRWDGGLKLYANHPDDANRRYGSVSAGSPLKPLTLEKRVESLEEFKKKVEKIINL